MTTVSSAANMIREATGASTLHRVSGALRVAWAARRDRPWLALLAVPLAMNASGLMQLWWLWPLLLAGSAACTRTWRWSWVLSFQLAAIGTEWAYVGATSLAQWPTHRSVVGAIWACVMLYVAGAANLNREFQRLRKERRWR